MMPFCLLFYSVLLASLLTACAQQPAAPTPTNQPPEAQIQTQELPPLEPSSGVLAPTKVTNRAIYHQVQAGETLYSIGISSGEGYQRLAEWNHISPPYVVKVGQKIRLNSPQANDTPLAEGANDSLPPNPPKKTESPPITEDKKSSISIDNGNMLKFNFKWPLQGTVVKKFAEQTNKGIDIEGVEGQPVYATADGIVVHKGEGLIGFGQLLIIKHNDEYLSTYSNTYRLLVSEGQVVQQGQVIAQLGKSGIKRSVLHFELRKNGKPINPLELLANTY